MTETQLLYACISMRHNNKIIDEALNVLKQFSENGSIYLYDDNGNCFKITKDTKVCIFQDMKM